MYIVYTIITCLAFIIGGALGTDIGQYHMYKAYKENKIDTYKQFELKYQHELIDKRAKEDKERLEQRLK